MSTRTLSGSGRTFEMAAVMEFGVFCLRLSGPVFEKPLDAGSDDPLADSRPLRAAGGRVGRDPALLVLEAALHVALRASVALVLRDGVAILGAPLVVYRLERRR